MIVTQLGEASYKQIIFGWNHIHELTIDPKKITTVRVDTFYTRAHAHTFSMMNEFAIEKSNWIPVIPEIKDEHSMGFNRPKIDL